MKPKEYTAQQAAPLIGTKYKALRQQLLRDEKKYKGKNKSKRKYPNAYKTACCGAWVIPERDLKLITEDEVKQ